MPKTATISTRIDPELKGNVEQIFADLGLTTTQAIMLFFKQVEMHKGLPFAVRVYNPETMAALRESEQRPSLPAHDDLDTLFTELEM